MLVKDLNEAQNQKDDVLAENSALLHAKQQLTQSSRVQEDELKQQQHMPWDLNEKLGQSQEVESQLKLDLTLTLTLNLTLTLTLTGGGVAAQARAGRGRARAAGAGEGAEADACAMRVWCMCDARW